MPRVPAGTLPGILLVYGLLGMLEHLAVAGGDVQAGLLFEYLVAAAGLVFFARPVRPAADEGQLAAGGGAARHPAASGGERQEAAGGGPQRQEAAGGGAARQAAVLEGLGLFAAIMALRLSLYATTGQVWGKAPMMVLTLGAALSCHRWRWDDLGLQVRRLGKQVALGALACLWVWILITASFLIAELTLVGSVRVGWARPGVTGLAVMGLILRFVQGNFAEELFFRGYLLRRWAKVLGPVGSLGGQALLFGLFHVNYHLFPPRPAPLLGYILFSGGFGLAMGIITQRTGTLLPAAMAHPFYNLAIACGLASPATTWMAEPWAPAVVVRGAAYLMQLALFWWVLPRLMDWSLRLFATRPRAAGTPYLSSAAGSRPGGPPRGAFPAG